MDSKDPERDGEDTASEDVTPKIVCLTRACRLRAPKAGVIKPMKKGETRSLPGWLVDRYPEYFEDAEEGPGE